MNEQALQQLYTLAQAEGYSDSLDEFKQLMSSNEEAINNMYNIAKSEGYNSSIQDFQTLVGFGGSTNVIEETEDVSMGVMPEDEKKRILYHKTQISPPTQKNRLYLQHR